MLNDQASLAFLPHALRPPQGVIRPPEEPTFLPRAAGASRLAAESQYNKTFSPHHPRTRIKWGYALSQIADLPATWGDAADCVRLDASRPQRDDVLIAAVDMIGRHTRLDFADLSKSRLLEHDLVGLAFSPRYATSQFEAIVPDSLDKIHFICAGGVCGQVVGVPNDMKLPTVLHPLGYLRDRAGRRVNLRDYALQPVSASTQGIDIIVVVGASMDSGKTTAAYSLINGLSRGGFQAAAAKISGTASAKDKNMLRDAGASRVLDFTNAGFASTCGLSADELWLIAQTLITQLAHDTPDAIVLEIADGVTQRETMMLLDLLPGNVALRGVLYTCNDALGVASGVSRLREHGLAMLAISGTVTTSPLSIREAERETDLPVLSREELRSPDVALQIGLCGKTPARERRAV